jgi:hypothetical protein
MFPVFSTAVQDELKAEVEASLGKQYVVDTSLCRTSSM